MCVCLSVIGSVAHPFVMCQTRQIVGTVVVFGGGSRRDVNVLEPVVTLTVGTVMVVEVTVVMVTVVMVTIVMVMRSLHRPAPAGVGHRSRS